ncbi:MAG: high-potential iron-sulfur protein [Halofilum sp. (in: g-proteobacteria)]|nr:high-potential iron-sulfur protein [Halofilum sp. (in: g-proteobacteria)]
MSTHPARRDRRRFIRIAFGGAIAVPLAGLIAPRETRAATKPKLDLGSKTAQRLDYTPNAESSTNPKREQGANCANCVHFRGDPGDAWASCNIFPDHRVGAHGWCEAWVGKG